MAGIAATMSLFVEEDLKKSHSSVHVPLSVENLEEESKEDDEPKDTLVRNTRLNTIESEGSIYDESEGSVVSGTVVKISGENVIANQGGDLKQGLLGK